MPLTATADPLRGTVVLTFPDPVGYSPDADRWQIARVRGNQGGVDGDTLSLTASDIIADIPTTVTSWTDHNPFPTRGTYFVRGRLYASPPAWSDWTTGVAHAALAAGVRLRDEIRSPFNALELLIKDASDPGSACVEIAQHLRYQVGANAPTFELEADYRAFTPTTSTCVFRASLKWYARDGTPVWPPAQTDVTINLVDSQAPAGTIRVSATPPSGATHCAPCFELLGAGPVGLKVRVERVALLRHEDDHDTGWEYEQVPYSDGTSPDSRPGTVDQTAFAYDGVGWSALTAPPSSVAIPSPYRQTSTPDDEITFLSTGQFVELLFYQTTSATVVEISRLTDSSIGRTAATDEVNLWDPIIDPDVVGATLVVGTNEVLNPGAEVNTTGWFTAGYINYPDKTQPFDLTTASFTRTTSSPITGSGSFSLAFKFIGEGVGYLLNGSVFQAGKTYRARVKLKRNTGLTSSVTLAFGNTSKKVAPVAGNQQFTDRAELIVSVPSSATEYTVYWTPKYDHDDVSFAIISNQNNSDYTGIILFDDVAVEECIGYQIAAGTDFATVTLELPGWFSSRYTTPYRVKLISGTMRPFGLSRDADAAIDFTQDFFTDLRALGELRNATSGELEFHAEQSPPTVYHHRLRGRDHSTMENGLDLRFGKNITTRKRSVDALNITNRLIVVGYGSDRTQLAHEVRALKDIQGRLPSDPAYRQDANGHYPSIINQIPNPTGSSGAVTGWTANSFADASFILSTTQFKSRLSSFRVLRDTDAGGGHTVSISTANLPAQPGQTWNTRASVKANTTARTWRIDIVWKNAANGTISTATGTAVADSNASWTDIVNSAVAPALTASAIITITSAVSTVAEGEIHYVADVIATINQALPTDLVEDSRENPDWNANTGGTSEDIYGARYGVYRDPQITTLYAAQDLGTQVVELSCWPAETYEVSVVDLSLVPKELQVGDLLLIHYGGRDLKRRVIEIVHDISMPRALQLVVGDPATLIQNPIERLSRDVDTAIAAATA